MRAATRSERSAEPRHSTPTDPINGKGTSGQDMVVGGAGGFGRVAKGGQGRFDDLEEGHEERARLRSHADPTGAELFEGGARASSCSPASTARGATAPR